ncbi:hypothetical protein [Sharpea azabuensis]|uniref:hypothetical protein n=1 Tax=Sharpea azabuensis TaxID=322505 RepID=UPI000EC6E5B3|nr:hypothetical protein [Sharpea azabuensis]HCJ14791.1 hypothetical protein [Erysipelotrichaceae bacterium]
MHSEYDERQKLIRAKGKSVGFMVMLVYDAILAKLILFDIRIPMYTDTMLLVGIILGAGIYYSLYDAYAGMNDNTKRLSIIAVTVGVFDFFIGLQNMMADHFTDSQGMLSRGIINTLLGGVVFILGIIMIVRNWKMKHEES